MGKIKDATKSSRTFEYITDKGSAALNEDSFVADHGKGIFAVFDGASSLNSFVDKKGRSGGFLASNIAREVFEKGGKSLLDLTFDANDKIREAMLNEGINTKDKLNLWATSVAAVKINKDMFDWVQVSDSIILLIYEDNSHAILVKNYEHDRETLTLMKELTAKGVINPRAAIAEPLAQLRRHMNITYGVVAGEAEIKFLYSGTESLEKVKKILLFSDGLLIPKVDPNQEDDFGAIVKEYEENGLRGWLRHVRGMEDSDPDMRKYVRYKPHDDATAIAVSV